MKDYPIIKPGDPGFWDPSNFLQMLSVRPKQGGLVRMSMEGEFVHQLVLAKAMMRCYQEKKWLGHVKPRQEGSSTFFTGVALQNAAFRRGCYAAILANKRETAKKLNTIAMRFWKTMPREIRPPRDTQLKRGLEFPGLDSLLTIASVKDDDPLRGDTVQFLLCTEVGQPQWRESGEDAFIAALNTVPDEYGMVVAESTPRHYGDAMHEIVIDAEKPGSKWLICFIPWTMIREYRKDPHPKWKPRTEVLDYAGKYGLTKEQAYWMETVGLPKCRNQMQRFISEYPPNIVDCFQMAGQPIFSSEVLTKWMQRIDGGTGIAVETGEWVEHAPPEWDHNYVIAIDPASSWAERDLFGLIILDMNTCTVVAEFSGHTTAGRMAARAVKWAERYNKALIAVEANGVGEAILSHLLEVYGYPYVFHRTAADSVRHGSERVPGFWSASRTKAAAISYLQDVIDEDELTVTSIRIVRQLLGYRGQWDKLKRDSHGGHFDLVAALAIAIWVYFHEVSHGRVRRIRPPSVRAAENWQKVLHKINSLSGSGDPWNTPWGQHR